MEYRYYVTRILILVHDTRPPSIYITHHHHYNETIVLIWYHLLIGLRISSKVTIMRIIRVWVHSLPMECIAQ